MAIGKIVQLRLSQWQEAFLKSVIRIELRKASEPMPKHATALDHLQQEKYIAEVKGLAKQLGMEEA